MKVDIIMPTFKRQHSIDGTLKTLYAQDHRDWSLILIDNDGSEPYSFDDARISVHVHNHVRSAAYARNQGLRYAQGDIVCFFDDDDFMGEGYLSSIVAAFRSKPGIKMVTVEMDANAGKPNLRYATPCCAMKREFATPSWTNSGQLQDQKYFKGIIRNNRWQLGKEIQHIGRILAFVGHSSSGGLRHPNGGF